MRHLNLRIFNKNGAEIVHQYNTVKSCIEGNLYMKPVSCGLFETETLIFLNEDENGILHPIEETLKNFRLNISKLNSTKEVLGYVEEDGVSDYSKELKLLLFIDTENQTDLRFFNVKNNEIIWSNKVLVGSETSEDNGVHLGFSGDKEGVYENTIYLCEVWTNAINPDNIEDEDNIEIIGSINVQSSTIGEDERYRNLFTNFGIPDPIKYIDVFKDNNDDNNEELFHKYDDNMDYDFLNKKSKKLFLTYSEIFPYVGTYKALINAVKYLGYDDIYFKEWYKELPTITGKAAKPISYEVSYKNKNSMLTKLPIDRRISLKKMNWLSMVYRITEYALDENGEQKYEYLPDNVQIPLLKNNYEKYEANEILIKLYGLKEWLEKNIIALNCRIIEINGEGIVIERYKHRIYGKTTVGSLYNREKSLTPFVNNKPEELLLVDSSCKIKLGLKEQFENISFSDIYKSISFRASLTTKNGAFPKQINKVSEKGTNSYGLVKDMSILVKDGELFFDSRDIDTNGFAESEFIKMPTIQIERANIRNIYEPWANSIEYVIDRKGPENTPYRIIRNKKNIQDNNILYSKEYISLRPLEDDGLTPSLKYTTKNIFGIPLFIFKNFNDETVITGDEKKKFINKEYILEILDGKFIFNNDNISIRDNETYTDKTMKMISLNFNFDSISKEQNVEINYTYTKNVDNSEIANAKNTDYLTAMTVNNVGDYIITAIATDEYNNLFANNIITPVKVSVPDPTLMIYSNNKNSNNNDDFYKVNKEGELVKNTTNLLNTYKTNTKCLLPETYLSNDIEVMEGNNGEKIIKYVTYPSISYAIDTPKTGDIAHFMNITDKFKYDSIIKDVDKVRKDYICVKFVKNNSFSANTLNTGDIDSKTKDFKPLQPSNIVIYDKLHNEIIHQEYIDLLYETNENYVYAYLNTNSYRYIYLYYKENNNLKTLLNDKSGDTSDNDNKLFITPPNSFDMDGSSIDINKILDNANDIMDFYIQPAYELPIIKSSINNTNVIQVDSSYVPNLKSVFQKNDIVKISLTYNKGNHTYRAGGAYKVIDMKGNIITLDKPINLINSNILNNASLTIAHANCAYVDYHLTVDNAEEISDGYINLYVKDDLFLNFIDNTFSITTKEYNKSHAHTYWMTDNKTQGETTPKIISNGDVFGYNIPITTDKSSSCVVFYPSCKYIDNQSKEVSSFYEDGINTYIHTYWRIYKFDKYKNEKTILFESWNNALYLNITDTGVYSLDLCMYDNYGNLTEKHFGEILKVID